MQVAPKVLNSLCEYARWFHSQEPSFEFWHEGCLIKGYRIDDLDRALYPPLVGYDIVTITFVVRDDVTVQAYLYRMTDEDWEGRIA